MGQRKIAAFIGLNFNLIVFLLHAMVGISDMNEDNPQIIFEPMWTIKRELVWIQMFGYNAASRRRANLHSLAHGQGYKRH